MRVWGMGATAVKKQNDREDNGWGGEQVGPGAQLEGRKNKNKIKN